MLDWDDLRFFLALSRNGSLSAASKVLNVAQTTVGRRLNSLEASLGVRLLNRTPDGYVPTLAGLDVIERAERLEAEALAVERSVGGRDTRLAGLVRVTCTQMIADHVLAPGLAAMHMLHPDIMVELIPSPPELSLAQREAEISVRLIETQQHDLVVRRIGTLAFGLYASPDYARRNGSPDLSDGCAGHHLITQIEDLQNAVQTQWLINLAPQARIAMQTGSHESAVTAARSGGGLACLARFRADQESGLDRMDIAVSVPSAGVWLLVHKDNRHMPRIRIVLTQITEIFRKLGPLTEPADAG